MSIDSINALEKAIKNENLLKKHNLEKIGIFGSFARGEKALIPLKKDEKTNDAVAAIMRGFR